MKPHAWIGALLLTLVAGSRGPGGEPTCCEPARPCFLQRLAPAGGWFPYGGGLLHWWDRCCFPRCGGPDDYCRKSLPPVCWPCYPAWYLWCPAAPARGPDGCDRACPPHSTRCSTTSGNFTVLPAAARNSTLPVQPLPGSTAATR